MVVNRLLDNPVRELDFLVDVARACANLSARQALVEVIQALSEFTGPGETVLVLNPRYGWDWEHILEIEKSGLAFSWRFDGLATGASEAQASLIRIDKLPDEHRQRFQQSHHAQQQALVLPLICQQDLLAMVLCAPLPSDKISQDSMMRTAEIAMQQLAQAMQITRLEYQLRSDQQQFETLFNTIGSMVIALDRDGYVLAMNTPAARWFGDTSSIGLHLTQLIPGDDLFAPVQRIISNRPSHENNWSLRTHSEQRQCDFDIILSSWSNPAQEQAGYILAMHDITRFMEMDRFKNDMMRMASHDMRSPLALIIGYCDIIDLDLKSPENIKVYVDTIRRTTERMDNLLQDLLRIDKIQSSPNEFHQTTVTQGLLDKVIEHTQPSAEQKHLQLKLDFHDLPETLVIDPVTIREAMENLVSNAIKYTPAGGAIKINAYGRDTSFYFVVEDNGIGIGKEHLPRLFTSFYRARQPGTEHVSGTGVGLSLVKTVVERHHGKVWVESEVGVGSQFGFWIPTMP